MTNIQIVTKDGVTFANFVVTKTIKKSDIIVNDDELEITELSKKYKSIKDNVIFIKKNRNETINRYQKYA